MFYLFNFTAVGGGNFRNIFQRIEQVSFIPAISFLVEMLKNIFRDKIYSCRGFKCFFAVNVPNFFVVNVVIKIHCLDIIDAEGQNIFIVDGVDDCVSVKFVAKYLLGCKKFLILNFSIG